MEQKSIWDKFKDILGNIGAAIFLPIVRLVLGKENFRELMSESLRDVQEENLKEMKENEQQKDNEQQNPKTEKEQEKTEQDNNTKDEKKVSKEIEMILENPLNIKKIKNPDKDVQLLTIQLWPEGIQYIKNPDEEIKIEAVKRGGHVIQYIENPSEQVQLEAVKEYASAIQYIENPSEAVQLEAVKNSGLAIQYIENPSEKVKMAAVMENKNALQFIENPSEELIAMAEKKEVQIENLEHEVLYENGPDYASMTEEEYEQYMTDLIEYTENMLQSDMRDFEQKVIWENIENEMQKPEVLENHYEACCMDDPNLEMNDRYMDMWKDEIEGYEADYQDLQESYEFIPEYHEECFENFDVPNDLPDINEYYDQMIEYNRLYEEEYCY